MKNFIFISFIAGAALGLGACHDNEFYCENAPQNDCRNLVDGRVDGPVTGCTAVPSKCTGDKPVCDTVTDTCVPCLGSNVEDMSCPAAAPVCSSQACGVCTADAQCSSGVCRADGTCSAAANVISVAPGGAGNICDKNSPCDLTTGVSKISSSKNVLHLAPGSYAVNAGLTLAMDVAVVGRGATLDRSAGNAGAVVTTSAKVALEFLTVTGGLGASGIGVNATAGQLDMVSCKVAKNAGGGVFLSGTGSTGFRLNNNLIVGNGGTTSSFGGVQLSGYTVLPMVREFAFNTIVDNRTSAATLYGGVTCSASSAVITLKSNLIYFNDKNTGANSQVELVSGCQYQYSDIESASPVAGTGNINPSPQFVDRNNGNYHLSNAAANVGIANPTTANDPAATLATDVDGQARPQGGGNRDLGADEVP